MSAFLGSPPALIPRPIPKPQLSCSQTPRIPPPPPPPPPPPSQQPQNPPELSSSSLPSNPNPQRPLKPRPASPAESTDWVASTLTRRFGLGAGLAWVAFLAVGVVSEQIKTRLETSQQEANTRPVEKVEETVLPNGIKYYELTVGGGGNYPRKGDLVVIDLQGRVKDSNSDPFIDTFSEGKRPLALVMGSRPYTKGMCEGIEYILSSMRAGGKRRVIVPPTMGFGDEGVDLGSGVQIPPAATLEYIVQVDKVSIAPS